MTESRRLDLLLLCGIAGAGAVSVVYALVGYRSFLASLLLASVAAAFISFHARSDYGPSFREGHRVGEITRIMPDGRLIAVEATGAK